MVSINSKTFKYSKKWKRNSWCSRHEIYTKTVIFYRIFSSPIVIRVVCVLYTQPAECFPSVCSKSFELMLNGQRLLASLTWPKVAIFFQSSIIISLFFTETLFPTQTFPVEYLHRILKKWKNGFLQAFGFLSYERSLQSFSWISKRYIRIFL